MNGLRTSLPCTSTMLVYSTDQLPNASSSLSASHPINASMQLAVPATEAISKTWPPLAVTVCYWQAPCMTDDPTATTSLLS